MDDEAFHPRVMRKRLSDYPYLQGLARGTCCFQSGVLPKTDPLYRWHL